MFQLRNGVWIYGIKWYKIDTNWYVSKEKPVWGMGIEKET